MRISRLFGWLLCFCLLLGANPAVAKGALEFELVGDGLDHPVYFGGEAARSVLSGGMFRDALPEPGTMDAPYRLLVYVVPPGQVRGESASSPGPTFDWGYDPASGRVLTAGGWRELADPLHEALLAEIELARRGARGWLTTLGAGMALVFLLFALRPRRASVGARAVSGRQIGSARDLAA